MPDENQYRVRLMHNDRDTEAMMELGRRALRRRDPEVAEACFSEALAMGLPEKAVEFDRLMAAVLREGEDVAVPRLAALVKIQPGDVRAWMALALLTDEGQALNRRAMRTLKESAAGNAGVRFGLVWIHLVRHQWEEAKQELERIIQSAPRHPLAWEMMAILSHIQGNPRQLQASQHILLESGPDHPIHCVQAALQQIQRNNWTKAEALLREGLRTTRHPDLLNVLANIRMESGEGLDESRVLLEEALLGQPFNPFFLVTNAKCHYLAGDFTVAERDLRRAREILPDHYQALLLEVRLCRERGEIQRARDVLGETERRGVLTWEQRAELARLIDPAEGP